LSQTASFSRPDFVRAAARGVSEDRDRLLEQSAVLFVERGMDQLGLNFGRYCE
jgi:hypothetical protein